MDNPRRFALFMRHVRISRSKKGCWIWTGATGGTGRHRYGVFFNGRFLEIAHRWAYRELLGRRIPNGLVIDHLCFVKLCVRPDHLDPITQKLNLQRSKTTINAINAAKTECRNGHPFSGDNLRMAYNTQRGCLQRVCRTCHRDWTRKYRMRERR